MLTPDKFKQVTSLPQWTPQPQVPIVWRVKHQVENFLAISQDYLDHNIEGIEQADTYLKDRMIELFKLITTTHFPVQRLLLVSMYLDRLIKYKPSREIHYMLLVLKDIQKQVHLSPEQRAQINNLFISDSYFENIYYVVHKEKIVD